MRALSPARQSRPHADLAWPARLVRGPLAPARLVAALCICLILFVGIAQLLHSHPAETSPDACSLCAVAHLTAMPAAFAAQPIIAEQLRAFLIASPTHGPPRFVGHAFFIRPPPVLNPHA